MPQINLLSTGQKKKDSKPAVVRDTKPEVTKVIRPALIRSLICFGIGLIIWAVLLVSAAGKQKILNDLSEKTKVLESNPKEIERVRNERSALDKKVKLIDELSSRKFLWYEKLSQIGTIVPSGIWFTEITSTKMSSKDLNSGAGERMFFIIRGVAVAYKIDDAITLVGDYIKRLQADQAFSKDFNEIKLNDINKNTVGGLDVMRFEVLCESK